MTIKIDIEQTTFPGDIETKADFAVTIIAGNSKVEIDLQDSKSFLSRSIHDIFEPKACDPQALQAISESYEDQLQRDDRG